MKKRVAYYVSRKNPLIWLAALVMLASAALRIANVCGKGADAKTVWFLVVLPVVGCVFYVLNILCNGSDRFYRSSVPVILLAIYYGIKITLVSPYLWLTFMFWIAYLAIAVITTVLVMVVSGRVTQFCRDRLRPHQEHDPAASAADRCARHSGRDAREGIHAGKLAAAAADFA